MNLKIKAETSKASGLTRWWIEDEYGGRLLQSNGFTDPKECQKNLDLVRQAFAQDAKDRGQS